MFEQDSSKSVQTDSMLSLPRQHADSCFYKKSCSESNIQKKPSSMLKCMMPTASPNREVILHMRVSGVQSWQVCEDEMPLKGIKFRFSGFNR